MLFCSIEGAGGEPPSLRQQKGLVGLPSMAFLDAQGEVLVRVPADRRTLVGFQQTLERAREYVLQRSAAAAGDRLAAARFLLLQLEERQLSLAAARERRRELVADVDAGADPDVDVEARRALSASIDLRILDLEVAAAVQAAGQSGRHRLGPRFLAMLRDGPRPSPEVTRGFWFAMLEWAERARDADAFAEALQGMREALSVTDPEAAWVAPLIARYEKALGDLRRE